MAVTNPSTQTNWESMATMMIMKKKRTAHMGAPGIRETAFGYTLKTNPGPEAEKGQKIRTCSCLKRCTGWVIWSDSKVGLASIFSVLLGLSGNWTELAKQVGKMMEHDRSESTQHNYQNRRNNL